MPQSYHVMCSLLNKIKFTETEKIVYHETELQGQGLLPQFAVPLGMILDLSYWFIEGATWRGILDCMQPACHRLSTPAFEWYSCVWGYWLTYFILSSCLYLGYFLFHNDCTGLHENFLYCAEWSVPRWLVPTNQSDVEANSDKHTVVPGDGQAAAKTEP
jgi:hypothetical protein